MLCANWSTAHCEYCVDPDRSHERALARHIGAADKQSSCLLIECDVVADALRCRDQWMTELLCCEGRCPVDKFGERIGGMLVAISCDGDKSFHLTQRKEPATYSTTVPLTPQLNSERNLNRVEQRYIDDLYEEIVQRVDVLHEICKPRNCLRGRNVVRRKLSLQCLQLRGVEGFFLYSCNQRGDQLQILQCAVCSSNDPVNLLPQRVSQNTFDKDNGEKRYPHA